MVTASERRLRFRFWVVLLVVSRLLTSGVMCRVSVKPMPSLGPRPAADWN